jgi:hypothetical protein
MRVWHFATIGILFITGVATAVAKARWGQKPLQQQEHQQYQHETADMTEHGKNAEESNLHRHTRWQLFGARLRV